MKKWQWLASCAAVSSSVACFSMAAQAAVTEVTITKVQPAFDGQSFGSAGAYERVEGTIKGLIDPASPLNSKIVDIGSVTGGGPVGYSANFMIFRPVDASKGNHKVVYDINNRGNVLTFGLFNDAPKYNNDPLTGADAGNGFLMRQGYTIAVSGWDSVSPDMPGIGAGPFKLTVPVAVNADGSPIVGPAMEEYAVDNAKTEKGTLTYPTADSDTSKASLMVRTLVDDKPTPIAADKWQFDPDGMSISLKPEGTKFEAGKLYNLVYQAKNPKITGLGYAAVRDFATFLRSDRNSPVPRVDKIFATCDSQPCRFLHDYVELGFNQSEAGGRAVDGVLNWEGGGSGLYLNYRFSQPYRTHRQRINRWFPELEFPFTYQNTKDVVTGKTAGWLDACTASNTCPLVIDANSENEYWAKNGALVHTDTAGNDLGDVDGVRIYFVTGRPHGDGIPVSGKGVCTYERNPLVGNQAARALLTALDNWASKGTMPPPSLVPRKDNGTLIDPKQAAAGFPHIAGVTPTGRMHTGDLFDYGPQAASGNLTTWPPKLVSMPYQTMVPAADADGNAMAGLRLPDIAAPIGTYTGWNNRANPVLDGCDGFGSFFPFAATKAERVAANDPRPSLEERYPDHASYVTAVTAAAKASVQAHLLLQEDADRYIAQAEASSVRR